MNELPPGAALWANLIPLVMIGIVLFRNARPRPLRVQRMWIPPAIVLSLTIWVFSISPPPTPFGLVLDALALVVGGLLGWWRARASHFTIDPETHVITNRVSPWGLLLILGIFALRYVLRNVMTDGASVLHISAMEITDSFLLLAVGLVSMQRVEWLIRARRMIGKARATSASAQTASAPISPAES